MHFCWSLLTQFMIIFKVLVFCFSALRKKVTIIPVKILFTIITHHIFIWHTAFTKYTKKQRRHCAHIGWTSAWLDSVVIFAHAHFSNQYAASFPCAHAAARKTNSWRRHLKAWLVLPCVADGWQDNLDESSLSSTPKIIYSTFNKRFTQT